MLIDRLIARIIELESPIALGLEPQLSQIPRRMKEDIFFSRGKTPEAAARIIYRFNRAIIDHIYDLVPAVTLQIALYEQFGVPGINCYIKTVDYARSKGLFVIGDLKRGDVSYAAAAYSNGHIGKVDIENSAHKVFDEDFITVNPYMGYDAVMPFIMDCKNHNKGIFMMVKTSNPGAAAIQNVLTAEGQAFFCHIGALVSEWGYGLIGKYGFSSVGAMVGLNQPSEGKMLREIMPHSFFLVPGLQEKGSAKELLKGTLNKDRLGMILKSSSDITAAFMLDEYKSYGEVGFAQAARAAVTDLKKDLQ